MNYKLSTGLLIAACFLMQTQDAGANNIAVTNISLTDTHDGYTHVQFDVSWDNSWRILNINWDAAWVFVKYRLPGEPWHHAALATSGHTMPFGSTNNAVSDGTGVFIYRDADSSGSNNFSGVKLRWNYGEDGLSTTQNIDVVVHAIEMVYIPQGSFYVGDGTSTGTLRQVSGDTPVLISTTGAVVKCENTSYDDAQLESNGIYADGDGGIGTNEVSVVNSNYPTGYKAFYCMKYEISQGQYADFLNKLTDAQDHNRYPNTNGNYRHTISGSYTNYSATVPDRACNYLSWADGCAYTDWAALRPMTELEYEKACRGPLTVFAGEYAWGNTTISQTTSITNDGTGYATANNGNCLYGDGAIKGPVRVGGEFDASGCGSRVLWGDGAERESVGAVSDGGECRRPQFHGYIRRWRA